MTLSDRIQAWHARQQSMHPAPLAHGWPNPQAYTVCTGPIKGDTPRVTLGSGPVIVLGHKARERHTFYMVDGRFCHGRTTRTHARIAAMWNGDGTRYSRWARGPATLAHMPHGSLLTIAHALGLPYAHDEDGS